MSLGMEVAITIVSLFVYTVGAGVVAYVIACRVDEGKPGSPDWDHPGWFIGGLFWPFVGPCLIGVYIARRAETRMARVKVPKAKVVSRD